MDTIFAKFHTFFPVGKEFIKIPDLFPISPDCGNPVNIYQALKFNLMYQLKLMVAFCSKQALRWTGKTTDYRL